MNTITSREAARRLNVAQETVTKLVRNGKVRAVKAPFPSRYGFRWLIDDASIRSRESTNGNRPASPALVQRLYAAESRLDQIEQTLFGTNGDKSHA